MDVNFKLLDTIFLFVAAIKTAFTLQGPGLQARSPFPTFTLSKHRLVYNEMKFMHLEDFFFFCNLMHAATLNVC